MNSCLLASILEKTDAQHSFRIVLHWTNTLSSAKLIACVLPYITSMYFMQYNWICGLNMVKRLVAPQLPVYRHLNKMADHAVKTSS